MTWKAGELARRAGVTIRALRHYDAIGLLPPSERQSNGYRLYRQSDLERLLLIQSLKTLGFPLKAIRDILASPEHAVDDVLDKHIELLEQRILLETQLLERLKGLREEQPNWHAVAQVMALNSRVEPLVAEFMKVSEGIQKTVPWTAATATDMTRPSPDEWRDLLLRLFLALEQGIPADSSEIRNLGEAFAALVMRHAGGEESIAELFASAYQRFLPAHLKNHWAYLSDIITHSSSPEAVT